MALRFDSSETETVGEAWSPSGDVVLQIDKPEQAILEIQTRLHDDADYVAVQVIRDNTRLVRLVSLPTLKLKIRKNEGGERVRVWSND